MLGGISSPVVTPRDLTSGDSSRKGCLKKRSGLPSPKQKKETAWHGKRSMGGSSSAGAESSHEGTQSHFETPIMTLGDVDFNSPRSEVLKGKSVVSANVRRGGGGGGGLGSETN